MLVGVGKENMGRVHFEMSPKAIMILVNKNVSRTTFKSGTMLNARDRAGDRKARPCSCEAYGLGWGGGKTDKSIVR